MLPSISYPAVAVGRRSLRRRLQSRLALAVLTAGLGLLLGCGHPPRYRLGSLPFPGPFTLYASADANLGSHRYGDQPRAGAPREVSRGTIYTCRAGFIDVAHLREVIDWTRHIDEKVRDAFAAESPVLRFEGTDRTEYELTFRYPDNWAATTQDERRHASLRIAQRSSLLLMTWHEVLTGQGYKTTGIVSERRSAFTYDDMSAHLVGVGVVEQALADPLPFDQAVTNALDARLEELGVVDRKCLKQATAAVKGSWWKGRFALRLQHETGRVTGQLDPFVIEELDCCPDTTPEALEWPQDDLPTIDLDAFVSIELIPNVRLGRSVAGGERISEDEVYRVLTPQPSTADEGHR